MSDWHVVVSRIGRWEHAVRDLSAITDIAEVLAPVRVSLAIVRGKPVARRTPWLGPLVLARWTTDDPFIWHDIKGLPGISGILGGWLPTVVSRPSVQTMLNNIRTIESNGPKNTPAPCQPGDVVRFTHLAFWRITAHVVWIDPVGLVGVRVGILGRDQVIPVPWAAVESVTEA